ncbi:MAG: TolC family protein [Candidatus Binataceae bacterium]
MAPKNNPRRWKLCWTIAIAIVIGIASANGAASESGNPPIGAPAAVDALVAEAMRSSPEIAAARGHYLAATRVPRQVSTLPDPEISFQHLTVGSPQPFSGYESSNFYYTGFGFSQEIPGPGKLGLRAEQARRDAETAGENAIAARRRVAEKVREDAFNLFFLTRARGLLETTQSDLSAIASATAAQYRTGTAQQQDVLKAQLAMTAILKDLEMNHDDIEAAEANLKAMLGREQDSRDIEIADVEPTELKLTDAQIAQAADAGSTDLKIAQTALARSENALEMARRDYWPDFEVGYMYQKTGPGFGDYYMLTVGAKIPLYFWRKQTLAVEQAALEKESARSQLRATRLETLSDLQAAMVSIRTQSRIVAMYRDGLIPQAEATMNSARAAYRTGKVDFQTMLSAVTGVLELREGYFRAIADHEIAVARVRQIIGDQS